MIEKFSCYEFKICQHEDHWHYEIYGEGCPPYDDGVIQTIVLIAHRAHVSQQSDT